MTSFPDALPAFRAALAEEGIDRWGVADFRAFREKHGDVFRPPLAASWPRSVVVLASAGGGLWAAYRRHLEREPRWEAEHPEPLDAWTERVVAAALARVPPSVRAEALHPFRPAWGRPVPFQRLAREAGLGVPSRLGILIHPEYGTWFGLRAAILTDLELAPTAPLESSPCDGCPAPCAAACRYEGAMTAAGWNLGRCQEAKLAEPGCRLACDARAACPVGAEHRYPEDAVAHHHGRLTARLEKAAGRYRKLTLGLLPSSLLLRTYFFTLGRTFSKVSK